MEYISILIPLYNGSNYLPDCLKSIDNQTYKKYEVIVGINGHAPGSEAFNKASKYVNDKIRVIEYPTKSKPSTLNLMVKDCKYDIICLLDVDDLWLPTKLQKQINVFQTGKYDVVGTFIKYFGLKKDSPALVAKNIPAYKFFKFNTIANSSVMLRKVDAHWSDVVLDDYDLWLRLALKNKTFYNIPEVLVLHRISSNSAFNRTNYKHVGLLKQKYNIIRNQTKNSKH